ncbi:MAG: hypothetical protein ACI4OT_01785 [Bacilli bacterium]
MEELTDLKKMLHQLNAPYKRTEAYEIFGDKIAPHDPRVSVFWDTQIHYVVKYENAPIENVKVYQKIK